MAQNRKTPCVYYSGEGSCERGFEANMNKACQKCKFYVSADTTHRRKPPKRTRGDLRKSKRMEYEDREAQEMLEEVLDRYNENE